MKNRFLNAYNKLGVINMTPNSFSDGGIHLDREVLKKSLLEFSKIKNLIIDIGAESTAPMNQAISHESERERLDLFFEVADQIKLFQIIKIISIDTYKIDTFEYVYQQIRLRDKKIKIIFNDVSGVIDRDLFTCLQSKSDIFYIYSATRIKNRNLVLNHMKDFSESKNISKEIHQQFLKTIKLFKGNNLDQILILDPAFGFSKTHEENLFLLDQFPIYSQNIDYPFLIGISKKSFLRRDIESNDPKSDSELVHFYFLKQFQEQGKLLKKQVFFRVHDPSII